ncbi:MAG: hypothetical protein KC620_05415 [Myxococcales bacterium]|nr:hypothetical protein [Myxococcales bacterium]
MPPFDEPALRAFGQLIMRMQAGAALTREETRDAYNQIFQNRQPELQQGAFIAVHRGKGETVDELIGVAEAHHAEWSRCFPFVPKTPTPHLGVVGVGMDTLKSFNVSSTSSVVIAACGVYVHKVGAPGMTGVSGAADAFTLWGVDPAGPLAQQIAAVEQCRLGFTTPVSPEMRTMGIGRVLGQMRIGTPIHFAGPVDRHSGEVHKIVGVPRPELVVPVCEVMRALGYKRALVPCGGSSEMPDRFMDEYSNIGPTEVGELREDGTILRYIVTPADAGLKEARYADVDAAETREANARVGALVLAGKDAGPRRDLVAINAGAGLWMMGVAKTLAEGTAMATEAMADGRSFAQIRALIEHQNRDPAGGLAALDALIAG